MHKYIPFLISLIKWKPSCLCLSFFLSSLLVPLRNVPSVPICPPVPTHLWHQVHGLVTKAVVLLKASDPLLSKAILKGGSGCFDRCCSPVYWECRFFKMSILLQWYTCCTNITFQWLLKIHAWVGILSICMLNITLDKINILYNCCRSLLSFKVCVAEMSKSCSFKCVWGERTLKC